MHANRIKSLGGIILGTAVGDALGLPDEGLSPGRIGRWRRGKVGHRFVFGRGMISDDTEHTILVCQALLEHPDEAPTSRPKATANSSLRMGKLLGQTSKVPPLGGVRVGLLDTYIGRKIGKLQPTREIDTIGPFATKSREAVQATRALAVLPVQA